MARSTWCLIFSVCPLLPELFLYREAYRSHGFFYCSRIHVKSTALWIFMCTVHLYSWAINLQNTFLRCKSKTLYSLKKTLHLSLLQLQATTFYFLSLCNCLFVSGLFHLDNVLKIHPCCSVHGTLLPFSGLSIFCCVFKAHFVYPFISGHLHCFHLLVIVNYAAKNRGGTVNMGSLFETVFSSSGYCQLMW